MLFTQTLNTTKLFFNVQNTKEYIVLHHTAWWTFKWNMRLLATSDRQVSVHYVVWQKWEIWKIWNDNDCLWHAWNETTLNWITNYNFHSIWIEVVSDTKWKWYTSAQRESVELLVKYLMQTYNIPKEKIIRHKDITKEKIDIDDSFWNNKFETYKEYIDNTYWKMNETEIYRKFNRYKIFNTTQEDYNKNITAWDIKDLIEIWFTNFIKGLKEKNLKLRKETEK